jgi:hypothetical protein
MFDFFYCNEFYCHECTNNIATDARINFACGGQEYCHEFIRETPEASSNTNVIGRGKKRGDYANHYPLFYKETKGLKNQNLWSIDQNYSTK